MLANVVRRQLNDLSFRIGITVQPILARQILEQVVKSDEVQPAIIYQQCMFNSFLCHLCNVDYVHLATLPDTQ